MTRVLPTRTRVRMAGTRTGRLRARVESREPAGTHPFWARPAGTHFEVSLGSEKWDNLDSELRAKILHRARHYLNHLDQQLTVLEAAEGTQDPEPPGR